MNNAVAPATLTPAKAADRLSVRAAAEARNDVEVTLTNVRGHHDGLTVEDAAQRLAVDGPNEVAHDQAPPAVLQFLQAFQNPFIAVLVVLAAISSVTDIYLPLRAGQGADYTGVLIIVTMVALSALLRFWQEYRSGKAAETLKAMVRTTATVRRRASPDATPELMEIPMAQVVTGDIVHLSAGDMIPADIRLLDSRDLFVSQAALTGEALPVEKYDTAITDDETGPLDLSGICFMGTNVVSGTATAVVVSTGADTYFGSLAKEIVGSRAETAFDRGVNSVSWLLIRFMLVMVPIVLLINGFTKGDWPAAFLFALAVAVGLTPEMLPMIVSSNLAKGAVALSRRKVVVKRLNAIQNFGAMDVLCTDKTGTLTQDRIILEHHTDIRRDRDDNVLTLAWLNSFHQSGVKNLMDRAVLHFAEGSPEALLAASTYRKVDELPFDFERRRLSVVVADLDRNHLLVCKGAVEEMLAVSSQVWDGTAVRPLTAADRETLAATARDYNREGFRVLLVATREIPRIQRTHRYRIEDERDLVVHGFLSFLDPPKETAAPALTALAEHGVTVKVLTGDNEVVTTKICAEVGLDPGQPVLGPEIDGLDDDELLGTHRRVHSTRSSYRYSVEIGSPAS